MILDVIKPPGQGVIAVEEGNQGRAAAGIEGSEEDPPIVGLELDDAFVRGAVPRVVLGGLHDESG